VIIKAKKYYGKDKFDSITYFGDGKWDYLSARELGLRFVGVDHYDTGKLAIAGANHVINDFSDTEAVLKLIYQASS
jgi:phosphoglycolate phosphatase-like HAD superfamily hydrolase